MNLFCFPYHLTHKSVYFMEDLALSNSGTLESISMSFRKLKMLFTNLGRSVSGKLALCLEFRPRAVPKTTDTVFPNVDLLASE